MQSLLHAQKGPIPASRFILVVAGALLLIPVYPFTAVSAAFSGIALICPRARPPAGGRRSQASLGPRWS